MRIDSASLTAIRHELLEMIANLEAGDVLKGRILEALENSVSIRTASGQVLTAALQQGVELQKGAFVELTVKNISDGKIYAEVRRDGRVPDLEAKLSRMLGDMNLTVDEKTIQTAKMLLKYNLPVSRESIVNILKLQNSIESLKQAREGKIGLLLSGLDIRNTPVEVLNKAALLAEPEVVKALEKYGHAAADIPRVDNNVNGENAILETEKDIHFEEATKGSSAEAVKNESNAGVMKKSSSEIQLPDDGKIQIKPEAKGPVSADGNPEDGESRAEALEILDRLGVELDSEAKHFAVRAEKLLTALKDSNTEALAFLLSKGMEVTPGGISFLIKHRNNQDKISGFLDELERQIEGNGDKELQDIKESMRKVFLKPDDVKESEQIKEKYGEILKLGEKLEKLLNENRSGSTEIRETLSNLRDNIDFIKNINHFTNYLQLPLIINNRADTAKLYVFKEGKRGRTVDPQNATILLALDLKNCGHLESLISVQGKSISITFRIEDKGTGVIIKGLTDGLRFSLEAKGYTMGAVKVINLEEPFNLMMLEGIIGENNKDRMHFDERI